MSKTRIFAHINDQAIELTNLPLIASGSVDVLEVVCDFCSLWDGYGKTAVFYREGGQVYHIPLALDVATVPHEVLADEGDFFFGIFGVADNTRTTEVLRVTVKQGAITSATAVHEEPTQGVYEEILKAYGEVDKRLENLIAMKGSANYGLSRHPLDGEYITEGSILTNGISAAVSFVIDGLTLNAYSAHYTDGNILPEIKPLFPRPTETHTGVVPLFVDHPNLGVRIMPPLNEGDWPYIAIYNNSDQAVGLYGVHCYGFYNLEAPFIDELADIRVGADGTIYPTAGTAVRKQASPNLKGEKEGNPIYIDDSDPVAHYMVVDTRKPFANAGDFNDTASNMPQEKTVLVVSSVDAAEEESGELYISIDFEGGWQLRDGSFSAPHPPIPKVGDKMIYEPAYGSLDLIYDVTKHGKNLCENDTSKIKAVNYILDGVENTRYGYEIPLPAGTYTIHAEVKEGQNPAGYYIYGCVTDRSGVRIGNAVTIVVNTTIKAFNFTIKSGELFKLYNASATAIDTIPYTANLFEKYNIQLEVGKTATPFEWFTEPETYHPDEDGFVLDLLANGDPMTLIADGDASLYATYNRDINKAFAELEQKISAMSAAILNN